MNAPVVPIVDEGGREGYNAPVVPVGWEGGVYDGIVVDRMAL